MRTFSVTETIIGLTSIQRRSDPAPSPVASRVWRSLVSVALALLFLVPPIGGQCLERLKGKSRTSQFDLEHDLDAGGNSFSCDVGVRASEALRVLEDFRYGFVYDSVAHLMRSVHFPLKVTVATSESTDRTVMINTAKEWLTFKTNHFDKHERALIACANLANVTIFKKWSGFAIGLGRVWFFNSANYGLRVGQINVAPMSESLFVSSCVVDRPSK